MKRISPLVLALAACALSPAAGADTCQWKDSAGHTVVSDLPPPGNARDVRCTGSGSPAAAPAPAAAKTLADKDLDFKKRQQEGKEKADKADKEQAATAERKENCERAKTQLAALESGQRMSTTDANGERRYLDDSERQREVDRTRKVVAEACK